MGIMASSSSASSPLLYACVAYNSTILSEHTTSASSKTSSLASLILPKIAHNEPQKLTYTSGSNFIHYIALAPSEYPSAPSAGGLTFLCVAQESLGRRVPFGFLLELKKKFLSDYDPSSTDFSELPSYGCAAFNSTLKGLMHSHGNTEQGKNDAIKNVQREMEDVREVMSENIERVLERGERTKETDVVEECEAHGTSVYRGGLFDLSSRRYGMWSAGMGKVHSQVNVFSNLQGVLGVYRYLCRICLFYTTVCEPETPAHMSIIKRPN